MNEEVGWVKLILLIILFMIPVWWLNIGIPLKWKFIFSVGVIIGIYLKVGMGLNLRGNKYQR